MCVSLHAVGTPPPASLRIKPLTCPWACHRVSEASSAVLSLIPVKSDTAGLTECRSGSLHDVSWVSAAVSSATSCCSGVISVSSAVSSVSTTASSSVAILSFFVRSRIQDFTLPPVAPPRLCASPHHPQRRRRPSRSRSADLRWPSLPHRLTWCPVLRLPTTYQRRWRMPALPPCLQLRSPSRPPASTR